MNKKATSVSTNPTPKKTAKVFNKARIREVFSEFEKKAPKVFWKYFKIAIRILSRALTGAVIFAFMAELAPGLREMLPNFYSIVDEFIKVLENFSIKFLEIFQ